jgi:predicted nucleotidyltransferase
MVSLATLDSNGVRMLRILLRGGPPMTGRALARVAGLSQTTAQRSLGRLREAGLVVAEHAPPALVYRANAEHLAMPALRALLRLEEHFRARLVEEVAGWQLRAESVVVYGSVARGEATAASDVDILVVRPDPFEPDESGWQRQIADLSDRVLRWTGRRASVVELSTRELGDGLANREPFLVEADRDGWLIAGAALHELAARHA